MNIKAHCPRCESANIGDKWVKEGKLQRYCRDCSFKEDPRIPEMVEIKTTKIVPVGNFYGFHYTVFDRYGHPRTFSRYYDSEVEARQELDKELEYGKNDQHRGPYKAVLWPSTATIEGEVLE